MARQPRQVQAGRMYLVQQRGHGHQPFVRDDHDRQAYVEALVSAALGQGLWLHGWAMVESEALLLVTPQRSGALSAAIQQLGRQYAQVFNRRWAQRGSPWDGRYRSCWVGSDLSLATLVWLDQSACRAGLALEAAAFAWSSAATLAGRGAPIGRPTLRPLQAYWQLGNTPFERERAYGLLLEAPHDQWIGQQLLTGLSSGRPVLSEAGWAGWPEEADRWARRPRGRPRRADESVPN